MTRNIKKFLFKLFLYISLKYISTLNYYTIYIIYIKYFFDRFTLSLFKFYIVNNI